MSVALLRELAPRLTPGMRVAWATKGFELDTGLLPHQVARQELGEQRPIAVLSGPTFAREVGAGLPTALTLALTGGAAARLAELTPAGHQATIHLSLTDDHPYAQAFVIIEALPLPKAS
mgnify:CR=1 FL=1